MVVLSGLYDQLYNFDIVPDNFAKLGTNIKHDRTTCRDKGRSLCLCKHSGGASCNACSAFIEIKMKCLHPCVVLYEVLP